MSFLSVSLEKSSSNRGILTNLVVEAPQDLLAYCDDQLPHETVRSGDVVPVKPKGVKSKGKIKRAVPPRVVPRPERMIQDEETPPLKKRRVAATPAPCRPKSPAVDSTRLLTLAKVNIDLVRDTGNYSA